MSTRALAVLTAGAMALSVVLSAPAADAQKVRVHKVKKDDTLALLAGENYGSRRYAILIMATNNIKHKDDLRPGTRLRIPINHEITTNAGDTLDSLAEQYLGDVRRGRFLAEFNGLSPDASLPVGMTIKIPLVIKHTTEGVERLPAIASGYFGSSKKSAKTKLIREYNFLESNSVEAKKSIWIPIDNVEVVASRQPQPDADSRARAEKRQHMQKLARRQLSRAQKAWYAGDYDQVKSVLTTIDTAYLDVEDAVEINVLLGRTYVAFDDNETALARFKKALERAPGHQLDPYEYSPKVRAIWQNAGGAIATPEGSDD